jgi:hypothetical protein
MRYPLQQNDISWGICSPRRTMTTGLIIFGALLLTVLPCKATAISGKIQQQSGNNIVLSISVNTASPANVIVEQYLSSTVQVVNTSPKAKKIEQGGKVIKWLLRNTGSGTIILTTTLKQPFQGNVSAVVRYRHPQTGQLTEISIR